MMRRASILVLALLGGCARSGPDAPAADGGASAETPFARDDRAAVREAVKAATGEDLGDDVCAVWPASFPGVVVVGGFAHDAGCMYEGAFLGRTWHGRGSKPVTAAALRAAGWAEADSDTRQRLAGAWVREVEQAFGGSFVATSTTAFTFDDTPTFEAPHVSTTESNGVVVSGWVQETAGMVWEAAFHFSEYRFAPDATLEVSHGRNFSVKGERIQEAEAARPAGGG